MEYESSKKQKALYESENFIITTGPSRKLMAHLIIFLKGTVYRGESVETPGVGGKPLYLKQLEVNGHKPEG